MKVDLGLYMYTMSRSKSLPVVVTIPAIPTLVIFGFVICRFQLYGTEGEFANFKFTMYIIHGSVLTASYTIGQLSRRKWPRRNFNNYRNYFQPKGAARMAKSCLLLRAGSCFLLSRFGTKRLDSRLRIKVKNKPKFISLAFSCSFVA